ncbi:hypothetical protein RFI_28787, partial [Reticulomyxa filosa]
MKETKLKALKDQGFYLFDWQQDLKSRDWTSRQSEKEQRLRMLFRILGTKYKEMPKNGKPANENDKNEKKEEKTDEENNTVKTAQLHNEIVKKLCDDTRWSNYVLTFDNILKMVAIFSKIRTDSPVILMGETGCGKTSLIKCLGHAANVDLIAIDVHGGFGRDEIRKVMESCSKKVSADSNKELWLFLDEVNTSPDIGWFKELICDQSLDGVKISPQIKVIAACNPYRQRKGKTGQINLDGTSSKWVYRVFPLCSTMKEYVWPFGQLPPLDEKQYIRAMTKQMKEKFDPTSLAFKEIEKWETIIAENISKSQQFLHKALANEAIASLRDVSRCLRFFHWLMQQQQRQDATVKTKEVSWTERALNIALSLSYYFRLEETQRKKYSELISSPRKPPFSDMVGEEITRLSESFQGLSQVAFHTILKENLFVLFFCIITATPMILVGEPGTSKTLSLQIVLSKLSHHSIKDFQKKLEVNHFQFCVKPLHCVSFQGTRNCKPSAIKETWNQAERYSNDKTTTTLLLFDEIGLAEQSQYNPLKILHQLLEHPKISFVGISNWTLDAAKMNRMVMHSIPVMSNKDLEDTAKSIFDAVGVSVSSKDIENLIKIYEKIIQHKTDAFKSNGNKRFFGARDFYALVKHQAVRAAHPTLKKSLEGYLRNFGGFEESKASEQLRKILVEVLGLRDEDISEQFKFWTPVRCVQSNVTRTITPKDNPLQVHRHCMVISEEHYSWQLLLDYGILNYDHVFLFGSCFPHDTYSNINNYNHLNKIIDCMDTGKSVVLRNLDDIYETKALWFVCFYLFISSNSFSPPLAILIIIVIKKKGNQYCRVALGTESRDCHVDREFKCVVVARKQEAHSANMPIAFLSRFEKQFISYRNALPTNIDKHLQSAREVLLTCFKRSNQQLQKLFCGYCEDTLTSALLYLTAQKAELQDSKDEEKKEQAEKDPIFNLNSVQFDTQELKLKLLDLFRPLCRPEEIIKIPINEDVYFHSLGTIVATQKKDAKNQMLLVTTNDVEYNIPLEWERFTKKIESFKKVNEFEKTVKEFFNSKVKNDVLILQQRYTSRAKDLLEQVMSILQVEHYLFYRVPDNHDASKLI